MENIVNEYNVTWHNREAHETFTATFGDFKGAREHANFLKKQELGDSVFITEVNKHLRVMPEEEWVDG